MGLDQTLRSQALASDAVLEYEGEGKAVQTGRPYLSFLTMRSKAVIVARVLFGLVYRRRLPPTGYLIVREPVMSISTSLLALCRQSGLADT